MVRTTSDIVCVQLYFFFFVKYTHTLTQNPAGDTDMQQIFRFGLEGKLEVSLENCLHSAQYGLKTFPSSKHIRIDKWIRPDAVEDRGT